MLLKHSSWVNLLDFKSLAEDNQLITRPCSFSRSEDRWRAEEEGVNVRFQKPFPDSNIYITLHVSEGHVPRDIPVEDIDDVM